MTDQLSRQSAAGLGITIGEIAAVANRAHHDQIDRDGRPHIEHVRRVVSMVPKNCRRVAWLHDALEDSPSDEIHDTLCRLSWDEHTAVSLLTRGDETYGSYIRRLTYDDGRFGDSVRLARTVKEADIVDNLRRSLETQDAAASRYRKALAILLAT